MAPRDLLTSLLTSPVASKLVSLSSTYPPKPTWYPTRTILPQYTFTLFPCSRTSGNFLLPHTTQPVFLYLGFEDFHNLTCKFPDFHSNFLSLISSSLPTSSPSPHPPYHFRAFVCDLLGTPSHCLGSPSPFSMQLTLQGPPHAPPPGGLSSLPGSQDSLTDELLPTLALAPHSSATSLSSSYPLICSGLTCAGSWQREGRNCGMCALPPRCPPTSAPFTQWALSRCPWPGLTALTTRV